VAAQIWRIDVGRVPLLFGSNVAENILDDRGITDPFSGGDCDMRPKHEILLGIGSCLATEALGSEPTILTLG
jgi:hypothetical protein